MSEQKTYPETADIETSSDDYAARFSGSAGEWMLSVQERIVTDMLEGMPGCTILDVGGGHGQLALPLATKDFKITVLGSSEECSSRIKPQVESGEIAFKVGNLIELPFEDDSFDVVVSIRLLPHCEQWKPLVKEMCRVAKKCVIVDYPTGQSINCLSGALFGAKKKLEGNTRPYTLFSHSEVASAFEACEHKRTALKKEFFIPMVLHRMIKSPAVSAALEGICSVFGLKMMLGSPVLAKFEMGSK